jgi:hypothetical protein
MKTSEFVMTGLGINYFLLTQNHNKGFSSICTSENPKENDPQPPTQMEWEKERKVTRFKIRLKF